MREKERERERERKKEREIKRDRERETRDTHRVAKVPKTRHKAPGDLVQLICQYRQNDGRHADKSEQSPSCSSVGFRFWVNLKISQI